MVLVPIFFNAKELVLLCKNQRVDHFKKLYIYINFSRDFAYIARDPVTDKHKCHVFRCHGNVSGRSITNALQAICNRVLDEMRKPKKDDGSVARPTSDLLRPPSRCRCCI